MDNQLYWTTSRKIAFRFNFIFILSFILLKNNGAFVFLNILIKPISLLFHKLTPWFSKNILHYQYDYSIFTNGSGDTSYDWVSVLILFIIALIGTCIWSLFDRHRIHYSTLYYYLTIFIRYYIAFMLMNYGFIKLMHLQMPPPSLNKLMQPLHEMSPMGLAWTFLGFSKGYNIFMGIVEILSILLLFRKTVVLGALITMATSINIMAVNYFYDVPVKMISTALFMLSFYLLIPNISRLFKLFISGKPIELIQIKQPIFQKKWLNKGLLIFKIIYISLFLSLHIFQLTNKKNLSYSNYKKPIINGIFKINRLGKSLKTIPEDWNYIIFVYNDQINVRDKNYHLIFEEYQLDTLSKEITINNYKLNYKIQDNGDIILSKDFPNQKEEIHLLKQHVEDFELLKRGFNFIQDHPYNR